MLKVKRILALALVLVMVCANLPWTAAAAALSQDGDDVVLTEMILPETVLDEEAISTDVSASVATASEDYIYTVSVQPPAFQVGDTIPDLNAISVYVDGGTVKEIRDFDTNGHTTFQAREYYTLFVTVAANEGKTFYEYVDVVCDIPTGYSISQDGKELNLNITYGFFPPRIEELSIRGLPKKIQAGNAQLPEGITVEEDAQITDIRWVDTNYETVESFADGNTYYLEMTFAPGTGYEFRDYVSAYNADEYAYFNSNVIDGNTARVYVKYSLLPDAGPVVITIVGIAPGLPIEQATIEVSGHARVDTFYIYDRVTDQHVETGVFDDENRYSVETYLRPENGYIFTEDTAITLNAGEGLDSWRRYVYGYDEMRVQIYYDNREEAGRVDVTVSGIEIGKPISGITYEVTGNAYVSEILVYNDYTDELITTGNFEVDNRYHVKVRIHPTRGYRFSGSEFPYVNGENYGSSMSYDAGGTYVLHGMRFDFQLSSIDGVWIENTPYEIAVGSVPQLDLFTDYYNCYVTGYRWLDSNNQAVTKFVSGKAYILEVTVAAENGYAFQEKVDTNAASYEIVSISEMRLYFNYNSLLPAAGTLKLNVSGAAVGEPASGFKANVTGNAVVGDITIYYEDNHEYHEETGNFQDNYLYEISIKLTPAQGYRFDDSADIIVNDNELEWGYSVADDGSYCYIFFYIDFRDPVVERIAVYGLPDRDAIKPGAVEIPDLSALFDGENTNQFQITNVCWVNENDEIVTSFASGQDYYLKVSFKAPQGYRFEKYWTSIGGDSSDTNDEEEVLNDQEAVAWFYYSLKPEAGNVDLTINGLEVGKPIAGLDIVVNGNAAFDGDYYVHNYTTDDYHITEGDFAGGMVYYIEVRIKVEDGYRFTNGTVILVNGEPVDYNCDKDSGSISFYFNTCKMIKSAVLKVGKVEVGKNIADAKLTVGADANYTIQYYYWYDRTDGCVVSSGKFKSGHKYSLYAELLPVDGYALEDNCSVSISDGSDVTVWYYDSGMGCEIYAVYSFLEKITKVELPAMPTGVKKGSTLSTNFKVSSSAKYTLQPMWLCWDEQELATKADKNGSYILLFYVSPKAGYEFSEDVVVYIDGKKTDLVLDADEQIYVFKTYTVGVTEIDRIDLTVPEPVAGEKPGKVMATSGKNYQISDYYWNTNSTGDFFDDLNDLVVFQDGKYIMLSLSLLAEEDYAFSNNLAVYVNGQKIADAVVVNYGRSAYVGVNLGKLGEVKPMEPPVAEVEITDGQSTLTWTADPSATAYEIWRSTSKTGKYELVDVVDVSAAATTFNLMARTAATISWQDEDATAGKTYYYKFRAVSSENSDLDSGFSAVFTMDIKCDVPELVATPGSTGKPVLTWNKVTAAKSYEIWRSVDGADFKKLTTVTKTTYTDTSASDGTQCTYKVKVLASSSKYNGEFSAEQSCYVTCAAPALTGKIDASTGKPSLSWKKVTGAVSYDIYRSVNGGDFQLLVNTDTVEYLDESTKADNYYSYYVVAIGKADVFNSGASGVATVIVTVGQPKLTGTVNDNGKPVITWEAVEDAVAYKIYRSTKSKKSYSLVETITGLTYTDVSVDAGKTFYYIVVAVGQNSENTSAYIMLTGKCAIPEITVEAGTTGKPVITWNKVNGAKKYEIWRSVDGGAFKKLTTVTKTTYTDSKATAGTNCTYKVKALGSKSAYNGNFSDVDSCYVTFAAPSLTVKVDTATGKPSLSWKKITGATAYDIYRSVNGGAFEKLTQITGVSYLDEATEADNQYSYYLVSVGKQEVFNSAASATKTVTVTVGQPKLRGSVVNTGQPAIIWDKVDDAVEYKVYRSTSATKSYKLIATVEGQLYIDTDVSVGKTYYYKVVAVGTNSESAYSSYVKVNSICAQPYANASVDAKSGNPVLTWEKISGAKKYDVYRATSETGKYSKIGTSTKTTYTDTKASAGTTYYYKVVAVGSKSIYNSVQSIATEAVTALLAQPIVMLENDSKTGMPVISWKKVSGAAQYIVMYADVTEYLESNMTPDEAYLKEHMLEVTTTKTSVTLTETEVGRVYLVTVVAVTENEEGFSMSSEPWCVTAKCAAPKITGFIDADTGKPGVYWDEVDGAEGYVVYRSTKSGSGYQPLDIVEDNSFIDGSAVKGKTYYYMVGAFTYNTENSFSNYVKLKSK